MLITTKMSKKGQVVIPKSIRESMGLWGEREFVVIQEEDHIILKVIRKPPKQELMNILNRTHAKAAQLGISERDLLKAIKDSREERGERGKITASEYKKCLTEKN